jgi:hypothetical protein
MSFLNLVETTSLASTRLPRTIKYHVFNGVYDLGNLASAVSLFTLPSGMGRFAITDVVYVTVNTPSNSSGAARLMGMGVAGSDVRVHANVSWAYNPVGRLSWDIPGSVLRPVVTSNAYLDPGETLISDDDAASYPTTWNVSVTVRGFFLGNG